MKIITKKQAKIIAISTRNSLTNVLKAHGIKPKLQVLQSFENKLFCSLGGKL